MKKKLLALTLSLLMIIAVMPASVFAAPSAVTVGDNAYEQNDSLKNEAILLTSDLTMLYVDIGALITGYKAVSFVYIATGPKALIYDGPMTHIDGNIYAYDISDAVASGETNACIKVEYVDRTFAENVYTDDFESGKNFWVVTSGEAGSWSVYEEKQLFSGGSGTEEDPYLISSSDDLVEMAEMIEADTEGTLDAKDECGLAQFHGYYFKQISDIDLSQINWTPFNFCGVYDGNGCTIKNLTVSEKRYDSTDITTGEVDSNEYEAAFFGQLVHAEIFDLTFENCSAAIASTLTPESGRDIYVAIVAATAIASRLENVNVKNSTVAQNALEGNLGYAGGLVGYADICNFTNCSFEGGSVTVGENADSSEYAGGLVGGIGDMYSEYMDYYNMSIGAGKDFGVYECSVKATISVNDAASGGAGGIAGWTCNDYLVHKFENCYVEASIAAGTVSGINGFGTDTDEINNCFVNAGTLRGSSTTGVYAIAQYGTVSNCVFYKEDATDVQGTEAILYTEEQLADGTALVVLGEAWEQEIGVDAFPKLKATLVTVHNLEWSGKAEEVNTPSFDLMQYLPEDIEITGIVVGTSNILSGYTPTYSSGYASVKLTTRVFDEPASGVVTSVIQSSNYPDITFYIKITLTGKYIVTIKADSQDSVYDGDSHPGFANVTGTLSNGEAYIGTYTYSYETADGSSLDGEPTEIGDYKVTISVPEDNEDYKGSLVLEFSIIEEAQASYQSEKDGEWKNGSFDTAIANVYDGGTVKLLTDIVLDSTFEISKNITITGQGEDKTCVITTETDAHGYLLNIKAEVTLENVVVDGGSKSDLTATRAAISVNGGKLTLVNGAVIRNNNNTTSNGIGGGVCVITGELVLNGGTVSGNSGYFGGGVGLAGGSFVAKSGIISANKAKMGGGVCVWKNGENIGTMTVSGNVSITENSAEYYGGGVNCHYDASVTLSENPVIAENTSPEETDGGIYLDGNKTDGHAKIYIAGLSDGAQVNFYTWLKSEGLLVAMPTDNYAITDNDVEMMSWNGDDFVLNKLDDGNIVLAVPVTDIVINLGARASDTNVRYSEIGGVVTEIAENNDTYTVEIGEDNLLIEFVEKTADGTFVKAQYFFVDMLAKTASRLDMDSYIYAYDETGIRVSEPTGIRFKAHILTSAKEEESAFVIDEYGYVLTRADVLGEEELTLETELIVTGVGYNRQDGTDVVYDGDDEKHIFTGVLKNIPVEYYKTDIVCKTYTKISVGEEQFVLYGEAVTDNVYDTAKRLLETEPDNAALSEIVLAYENAIGIPGDDLYE